MNTMQTGIKAELTLHVVGLPIDEMTACLRMIKGDVP